jgi:glycosyltransferase involved in cell wall biosynthesis
MLFVLAGEGVQKETMMQKGRELGLTNVVWLPMLPRERYPSLLHASDVCLTTLHADVKTPVVPSKILSTMAAGRPVVAALPLDGDAPRLIALAEAGCSVPPEDPAALAEALLRLEGDPALCRRFGENGRRFAESHLSPAGVASDYRALFGTIASRRGANARPVESGPGPKETPWTH